MKDPDVWWKMDDDEEELPHRRHAKFGCTYCTFNFHYDCKPNPKGCKHYLWNGKEPTAKYCDDCRFKDVCKIKELRDRRGLSVKYCGYWREEIKKD